MSDPGNRASHKRTTPEEDSEEKSLFTPYASWEAVGGWLAIMSCRKCGAAVLAEEEAAKKHQEWHADD